MTYSVADIQGVVSALTPLWLHQDTALAPLSISLRDYPIRFSLSPGELKIAVRGEGSVIATSSELSNIDAYESTLALAGGETYAGATRSIYLPQFNSIVTTNFTEANFTHPNLGDIWPKLALQHFSAFVQYLDNPDNENQSPMVYKETSWSLSQSGFSCAISVNLDNFNYTVGGFDLP